MIRNLGPAYTPLYFLAALGNGGLSVSFYMYLMFMIPHPSKPMITYDEWVPTLINGPIWQKALIIAAIICIIYFAFRHFQLLIWNIREYGQFKKTPNFQQLKNSNHEVSLMTIPLTLAMSINVFFVLGATFIPNLWASIELLFPLALIGFILVGTYGSVIFGQYFVRLIAKGDNDFIQKNSLSHMIAIFAFSMIAVGLAAPGAMSTLVAVSATSIFFSIFFATVAISLAIVKLVLGLRAIFKHGILKEESATLLIIIPIITLLGITFVRLYVGIQHNFLHQEPQTVTLFIVLSALLSLQLFFGLIGYFVLRNIGYFTEFIHGEIRSVGGYALICPGVAFFVLGMFFVFWGLVRTGIVEQFSLFYFIILAPMIFVQFKTISILHKLNIKVFKS